MAMAMILAAGAAARFSPWKDQKLQNRPYPGFKGLEDPLKPPRHGLGRRHTLDHQQWELTPLVEEQNSGDEDEDDSKEEEGEGGESNDAGEREGTQQNADADVPELLEHVVMPEDTLAGICIRYKVSDRELRRLNGFVGNHIQTCSSLVIPNRLGNGSGQKTKEGAIDLQPHKEVDVLQNVSVSPLQATSEEKPYMVGSNWDLDTAPTERRTLKSWKSHRNVRETPSLMTPQPQKRSQPPSLPPTPRNWLRRRGLRMLGPPKAAPVGRCKTGPARRLKRSASLPVSGATANSEW